MQIYISTLIDKDIRIDIQSYIESKHRLFGIFLKTTLLDIGELSKIFDLKDERTPLPPQSVEIIRKAQELLLIKIEGRKCKVKYEQHCLKKGINAYE